MTFNSGSVATGGEGQIRRFPTQLGEFVRVSRMAAMAPHDEWMAIQIPLDFYLGR